MAQSITRRPAAWILALLAAPVASLAASAELASNRYPAELNYTVNCSGCHMADGSGYPGRVPSFRGNLGRYLAVPEGRAYVVQVPGAANALLSSHDLAEVLNWTVRAYDAEHVPANFVPYDAAEVARLRREPISAGSATRARILAQLAHGVDAGEGAAGSAPAGSGASGSSAAAAPVATAAAPLPAPPAFAICGACHPVSAGGEHSIGPNLRGVVGRRAGTAPNYSYSKPMRESGITWTAEELDSYLTDVAAKVPGTLMSFNGLSEAADRAAVIAYLQSLQPK